MKNILKFLLLVILTTIAFVIVSAILPFSEEFQSSNKDADPSIILYFLLINCWTCFTIIFVMRYSSWSSKKVMIGLMITLFFVHSFMTQIETLFFSAAFPILTYTDIFLITISNGVPFFVGVPLALKLFGKQRILPGNTNPELPLSIKGLSIKLALIGILYVVVYFGFGYFVAWQEQDLRVFYSGNSEDSGFIASLENNYQDNPLIFPFQFMRGILFGLFVLPIVSMFFGQSKNLFISLALVYTGTGISLIVPNFLFPDSVRWAHFREMMSSMFIFSIIVWWIFDKLSLGKKLQVKSEDRI